MSHVQQRDGRWCIVDLVGKHGRVRTVPMPTWVRVAIEAWTGQASIVDGHVFRPVNRGGQVEALALSELLLGHASVQTTERYLGTKQDLVHAPNDGIKLRIAV